MELCTTCGNPTASDITGACYCVVCGSKQPTVQRPPKIADDSWLPWLNDKTAIASNIEANVE